MPTSQLAFGSGEEAQIRTSRWRQSSWICDRNDLYIFLSTNRPDTSYQLSSQLAFQFRNSNTFLDGRHAATLDFRLKLFGLYFMYMLPRYCLPRFESIGLSVKE